MQGTFHEDENPNFFEKAYKNRQPLASFLKFDEFSVPTSTDEAFKKIKFNASKFSLYYLFIMAVLLFIVLICKPILLIPIIICASVYFAMTTNMVLCGYTLNTNTAVYTSVGLNVLLLLVLSPLTSAYLYLLAFMGLAIIISAIHGSLAPCESQDANQSV